MLVSLLIANISVASGLLPIAAAAYNYKRLDSLMKLLALFLLISCCFDLTQWIAYNYKPHDGKPLNTIPLLHLFVIISIVFFGTIYYNLFSKPILKTITIILSGVTLSIVIYKAIDYFDYPSISNTASGLLLIILSLIYFYQLLNPQTFIHIEKQGPFWFNSGVLFYSAVNIFLFMVFNRIPDKDKADYYVIFSITNIITNLIYSVALLCKPQKKA
ncbi:glucan phosphoethanolaminetransferase (alkaline phosphatase superfamily) [Mucilaginibacter sp. SG538B]|uniref:hypothetical protein n=1 Tax=Mucilaginibacter sp. SG538B TaxID=2587021 RepID=UPI00159D198E|nr:hypothetical protein [Mucilaginibacter sp. SG538B]NVM64873.1 glucan phosphoethanolaminetransferase (alkaline phosphatase superfamily) [Mucilaginibacter sp. SG538B]